MNNLATELKINTFCDTAIDFLKTISYHRFEAKSGKCFRRGERGVK
jgi:hypothetical protein